jgi:hypothetical protein
MKKKKMSRLLLARETLRTHGDPQLPAGIFRNLVVRWQLQPHLRSDTRLYLRLQLHSGLRLAGVEATHFSPQPEPRRS